MKVTAALKQQHTPDIRFCDLCGFRDYLPQSVQQDTCGYACQLGLTAGFPAHLIQATAGAHTAEDDETDENDTDDDDTNYQEHGEVMKLHSVLKKISGGTKRLIIKPDVRYSILLLNTHHSTHQASGK